MPSTEARHRAVLALDPKSRDAVSSLLGYLGDPSWRVRKSALGRLPDYRHRPTLVVELIAGLTHPTNAGLRNACAEGLRSIGESVEVLIAALHTTNTNQRKVVAEILGSLGSERARQKLLQAIDDPDPNARGAVAEALGNLGGPDVIRELQQRLERCGDDLHESTYLLDGLARAGAELPFEVLEPWLARRTFARQVFPLLGLSGDPRAVDPLLAGAESRSFGTRRSAILALDALGRATSPGGVAVLRSALLTRSAARTALIEIMSSGDDEVAAAAARVLGLVGEPSVAPAILAACTGRGFLRVGIEVVQSLGAACVPHLVAAIPEADTDTRVLALEMIEVLGGRRALGLCVELARSDEVRVAEAAIRVLGAYGDGDAGVVDVLLRLLDDGDGEAMADEIALALAAIGARHPDAVAERVRARLQDVGQDAGRGADRHHWVWYQVLGSLARPHDRDPVVAGVGHPSPLVRCAAIEATARFGEVPVESLLAALVAPEAVVRAAAARAFAAYPTPGARAALRAALGDVDPWVVAEALRALAVLGGGDVVAALRERVGSEWSPVVIAALEGLTRLQPTGLGEVLRAVVTHPEPEVVRVALQGTAHLSVDEARPLLTGALEHDSWNVRRTAAQLLAERGVHIAPEVVEARLADEGERLVREALERVPVAREAVPS